MTLQERFRREYGHHCWRSFHDSINKYGIGRMIIRQTAQWNRTSAIHYPRHWSQQHGPAQWPPKSPDLKPIQFYLRRYVTLVYGCEIPTCVQWWQCLPFHLHHSQNVSPHFPVLVLTSRIMCEERKVISFNTSINITFHTTVLQVLPMVSTHCEPLIISRV